MLHKEELLHSSGRHGGIGTHRQHVSSSTCFFKLADETPHLRDFMNITGFPFHFSAIFQFRTQIRLQYNEEQETRATILSSSPMFTDTHFFAFNRSEWASRCRTGIEGLGEEIRLP